MKYKETWAEKVCRETRSICNKLTDKERADLLRKAKSIINSKG
jgi:hypothetical protein